MPKISELQHHSDSKNGSTAPLVSSEVIAANEHLLILILILLPVKSLLRFKSVSKDWLSLISSPNFRSSKSKCLKKEISGLFFGRRIEEYDRSTLEYRYFALDAKDEKTVVQSLKGPDFLQSGFIVVKDSCNGLLLCEDTRATCKYYVFNPSTNENTTISLDRVLESGKVPRPFSVSLAFDPRESFDYKLICIYWSDLDESYDEVWVYSSETGLLRQVGCPFQRVFYIQKGVYWNGAINWVGFSDGGLYFNVKEERFGTLPLPPVLLDGGEGTEDWTEFGRGIMYFGESNDHLHLIEHYNDPETEIDVYELDKGYSGWFLRFRVDLQPGFSSTFRNPYRVYFMPVCIVRKENDKESFLVLSISGKAFRLKFEDMSLAMIFDCASTLDSHRSVINYDWCSNPFQFIASLYQL